MNIEVASVFMQQHCADWEHSAHTTSSKRENSSNATISSKPKSAMDETAGLGHTVGVPLPTFTVSLSINVTLEMVS